jgi:hypothetical protein
VFMLFREMSMKTLHRRHNTWTSAGDLGLGCWLQIEAFGHAFTEIARINYI